MTAAAPMGDQGPSLQYQRRRGRFITLEGGEGAGKSTQQRLLMQRLEGAGIAVIGTREPGGSPMAEELRTILLSGAAAPFGTTAEALLFSAARIDHLDTKIRPALARGTWVVCDRFSDSTRAYQGALGNIDPRLIVALERVTLGPTRPDLTLVLDLAPEIGLARALARRGLAAVADRFEAEDLAFHSALRTTFREIAAREPKRCALVNASSGPEAVAAQVWDAVSGRLFSARMRSKLKARQAAGAVGKDGFQ